MAHMAPTSTVPYLGGIEPWPNLTPEKSVLAIETNRKRFVNAVVAREKIPP